MNYEIYKAIEIANEAFKNKKDLANKPYILHCLYVMQQMKTEEEMIVGLLHDLIEDTNYTLSYLQDVGFNIRILTAIDLLTHEKNDSYQEYINKIIDSKNLIAIKVKIADLKHNLDLTRLNKKGQEKQLSSGNYDKHIKALLSLIKYNKDEN